MKVVRKGWMVAAAVVLGVALGASQSLAADAPAAPKPPAPKKMIVSGLINGVLRVPDIAVWSCPGGQQGGCNLVATLPSGTEVMRHESEIARGLKWYRVVAGDVEGWVIYSLLARPK